MFVAPLPPRKRQSLDKQRHKEDNAVKLSTGLRFETAATPPKLGSLTNPLKFDDEDYSMSETPRCSSFRHVDTATRQERESVATSVDLSDKAPRSRASSFASSIYSTEHHETTEKPAANVYDAGLTALHATGDEGGFLVELNDSTGSRLWPVSFGELCRLLITREQI